MELEKAYDNLLTQAAIQKHLSRIAISSGRVLEIHLWFSAEGSLPLLEVSVRDGARQTKKQFSGHATIIEAIWQTLTDWELEGGQE